jgi:pentose-5-phosphate-3-epimerase
MKSLFMRKLQVEAENPVELVLVMTVEPGFGGQKFMPEMMDKALVVVRMPFSSPASSFYISDRVQFC